MSYWMAVRRRLAAAALAAIDIAKLAIAYTGNMTDEIVTMGDGNQYRLLTLTSSGTLSIPAEVKADVWLCGGGANGQSAGRSGGGGGYVNSASGQTIKNIIAVVGAAAGASSFGNLTANGGNGANGGSGGGGGGVYSSAGTGAGHTTYPFSDTTYFSGKPHCAGGAGGINMIYSDDEYALGGNGGSNGGNGENRKFPGYKPNPTTPLGGGLYGGGNQSTLASHNNATFYGGGGAGGYNDQYSTGNGGSGYQGVIYVRIPLKPQTISDFQLVEYIQSTGTQYVDSGVKGNQNTRIDVDYEPTVTQGVIAGADGGWLSNMFIIGIHFAAFATASYNYESVPQGRHVLSLNKGALSLDGTIKTTMNGSFTTPCNITLFTLNRNGSKVEYGSVKLYSTKIFDNDVLIRDFVPCYRKSDNVPGLWDKVDGKFYTNAGSGSFTVGQNV